MRLLTFATLLAASAASADTLFLETEAFESWGGWVNDTQFMGTPDHETPYLLAHGMGKPVADATTRFRIETGGKHAFRVRTQNWTGRWSDCAAGTFKLAVDGKELPNTLGAKGKGEWLVEFAGTADLEPGTHTLALKDLTGFDGRCDWVQVSTDLDESSLTVARPERGSRLAASAAGYDLVVVGGGIAGVSAAVSAARLGLVVALLQDRPVLGGNNSSEVRVHLGAWANKPPYPNLGHTVAEMGPARGGNAQPAAVYEDGRKLALVKAEKNIRLHLNSRVTGVDVKDGRIVSVRAADTRTGAETDFFGALFADCTGDGTVGFLAGADYRQGREAKSETNEPDAPETADSLTMGASVQWYAGTAAGDAAFPVRPWMIAFDDANGWPILRGDWWWETGFGRDQVAEAEHIRDYGLLVVYSNWAFVKNGSTNRVQFADKELKWVAYNAGRRESRRLMGDFILDQNHLRSRDFQPDGTCATTWTIDLHYPKTAEQAKFGGEPFQTVSRNETIWPYPIPYRCLYSRNVPNLFMAGRDISVTHIALGTTRLMRTHGMMGEVVGMAASVCRKRGCDPRAVYADHLDELKELMAKGVGNGSPQPPQLYNIQDSLDPEFRHGRR